MRKLAAAFAATLVLLCFALAPALAQNWPQKPIRMIVPFPAGGGTDVVARLVAESSVAAAEPADLCRESRRRQRRRRPAALKQSEPDGYTLALHLRHADDGQSLALQGSVLRSAARLRAGGVRGAAAGNAGGEPGAAGEHHRRADRAGQAKARRHRLWLSRCRQFQPSGDGAVLAGDRREDAARAV